MNQQPHQRYVRTLAACLFASIVTFSPAIFACATCGCTLSSDAANGFGVMDGWRISLEFNYLNQDQLRSGTHTASAASVVNAPANPSLDGAEIEHQTLNRYLTAGLTYSPHKDWRIDLKIPYISRDHSTFGEQQSPYVPSETAPNQLSSVHVGSLGDIKLISSYLGLLPTRNLGIQLGIKLPTGEYGSRAHFSSGPAADTPLDASLQAGTGTTDALIGAYYFKAISQNVDAFASGQFQAAVKQPQVDRDHDYRPGNATTISMGVRYLENPRWVPALQINVSHRSADQGALADTTGTAGSAAYLSPGITVQVTRRLHAYGFVQVPIYSNLNGYQLFPRWTASLGVGYAL
jgi:hypothetical protein